MEEETRKRKTATRGNADGAGRSMFPYWLHFVPCPPLPRCLPRSLSFVLFRPLSLSLLSPPITSSTTSSPRHDDDDDDDDDDHRHHRRHRHDDHHRHRHRHDDHGDHHRPHVALNAHSSLLLATWSSLSR